MKPHYVPVIFGGRRGVRPFSPIDLFTGGVQGAWYDPSDYSTLFQDSSGTTPVTAVEQPVRLMLDKSQGLVLGSELVTNGDFSGGTTGWTAGNSATLSTTGGKLSVVNGALALGQGRQTITTVAGKTYKISVTFTSVSASRGYIFVGTFAGDNSRLSVGPLTTSQTVTGYFTAAGTNTYLSIGNADNSIGLEVQFDDVTVKEIAGNHALAPNDASRPVLRARYNLLTYSEQFDNAAWSKSQTTLSANTAIAPDGTTTADSIRADATTYPSTFVTVTTVASTSYTLSIYAKSNTTSQLSMEFRGAGGAPDAVFNLSSGTVTSGTGAIVSVGNGWYRCSITKTSVDASEIAIIGLGFAPAVNDSIYIWGAQLVTGSSAGTYQRIAAATDYATAGFLPYLAFDGTDDSFGTNSINFSATDKMSVCAGVTKLSDAAVGMLVELSADLAANNGSFSFYAPSAASPRYAFFSKGTSRADAEVVNTIYAAPQTSVLTGIGGISAPNVALRFNGAQVVNSTATQGTGNYGNYPLYIGRRNNASLPFNGRIYGLIVAGKQASASEISATESWMAAKTGVTL